jgi:hypothetical protein
MPAMIRLRTDRISADLAAHRLQQEGVPAQVVSDDDRLMGIGMTGTPLSFSLVVPSDREDEARRILSSDVKRSSGRPRRLRADARRRRG